MARRPTPMDFFAQFDDVEVRQLSVKEVEALRAMAVLDHNEFVAKLAETLESVAIDLVSVFYHDALFEPGSKTNLNMQIKAITRMVGIKHILQTIIDQDEKLLDLPHLDVDAIRIEFLRRIDRFRRTGE